MAPPATPATEPTPLSPRWRAALSILLLLHLAAVFIAPFTFATQSGPGRGSPLAMPLMNLVRPYIDAAYLNHGYFFFAPNPGPSHLVRWRAEYAGDRPAEEHTFPNLDEQWPRLLYHRHFMLSEYLTQTFEFSNPPPASASAEERRRWRRGPGYRRYSALRSSYQRRLREAAGAERVEIERLVHLLPSPPQVLEEDLELDDPSLYRVLTDDASRGESP